MKDLLAYTLILLLFSSAVIGCQVVGDIFGAGVYTGIFIVVFIIAIIIFIFSRISRRK